MVGDVRVEDPRFEGPATRVVDRISAVPAGGRVDIRVQLPPVACPAGDAEDADSSGATAPEVVLEIGDDDSAASVRTDRRRPARLHRAAARARVPRAGAGGCRHPRVLGFEPSPAGEPADPRADRPTERRGAARRSSRCRRRTCSTSGRHPSTARSRSTSRSTTTPPPTRSWSSCRSCRSGATRTRCRRTSAARSSTCASPSTESPARSSCSSATSCAGRILTWVAEWCDFGAG